MSEASAPIQATKSEVSAGRSGLTGWQKIATLGIGSAVVVGAVLFQTSGQRQAKQQATAPAALGTSGGDAFRAPALEAPAPPATPPMPSQGANAAQSGASDDPIRKARQSSILGGAGQASRALAQATGIDGGSAGPHAGADGDSSPLSAALKPTMLEGTKATVLPHPAMTITMGTAFQCTPQQPITSDLPGMVSCIVPIAVRGTTGTVELLPAGTKIVGTIQGMFQQGHQRLFVLWQRAETPNPDHVIIALNSPGADQIGQAGLEGDVSTHFWQRFGGAILLSFIDTGLQAAAATASSSGGNGVSFNSFQSGGQSAASTALNSTINIPPTLHRDQALPATVFTARDLDFSGVYGLRMRNAR